MKKAEAMYTESSASRLKQHIPVIHNVSVFIVSLPYHFHLIFSREGHGICFSHVMAGLG